MRGLSAVGLWCLAVVPVCLLFASAYANGEELIRTDASPGHLMHLGELFDQDLIADDVYAVIEFARSLPIEARYEFLKSCVLPGATHSGFRLNGKLTATNPPEPLSTKQVNFHRSDADNRERRVRSGGRFVSPVFELLETAHELNCLSDLATEAASCSVSGEVQERCQLSFMTMIEIARGEEIAGASVMDELYQRFLNQRFSRFQDRMPETLLLSFAVERAVLLDEASLFLVSIQDSQIRAGKNHGPTEWDVLITHLIGRIRHLKLSAEKPHSEWSQHPPLHSWHWVTRSQSWTNGLGLPNGHVHQGDNSIDVLGKMDDEYLLFESPLRGNYTVECLCTGFGWKEIHPLINGRWMTPVYHHEAVQFGEMFRFDREQKVSPKFSRVDEWIRYRVDVRDGVCRRYLNSRLISKETLPPEHDPWIAIRNPGTGTGSVRHVHISGQPVVPNEVRLSELRSGVWLDADAVANAIDRPKPVSRRPISHILNWIPWHEDPWKPELHSWQLETEPAGPTQIVGYRKSELSGTGSERMLRHLWPLVWDCEVSYEFFYEEGQSIVHPVLGLNALVLCPMDVKTHWVTNGVWDDSGLDPLNVSPSNIPIATATIPLKSGKWNQMTLQIVGDELRLRLNDTPNFAAPVAETNDRTFGLFYFCDQSEARVRNVILRGDWPKQIPSAGDQELRSRETDQLDQERMALKDSFEIDFTKFDEREMVTKFVPSFSDPTSIVLSEEGLQMSGIAGPKEQSTSTVGPRMAIEGDFDAIAEFADLQLQAPDNGVAAIYLGPRVVQPAREAFLLFRGIVRHPDTPLREITQVEILQSGLKGFRYAYPAIYADECRAGRLRLARRGKMFHYLIAPLDSEHFRLLHSMEATDARIERGNFLLRTSCYSQGTENSEVHVTWKSLSVRATVLRPHGNAPLDPRK